MYILCDTICVTHWKEIAEENSLCKHPGQLVLRHTGRTHEDGTYVQTGMKRNGTSNMVQWFIVWLVTECEPGPKSCGLELSLASAVTYYWHLNIRKIYLTRKDHLTLTFVFLSTADAPAELNCSFPQPKTWQHNQY